jgi:hypothetical protein
LDKAPVLSRLDSSKRLCHDTAPGSLEQCHRLHLAFSGNLEQRKGLIPQAQ